MSVSDTSICNEALQEAGARATIASLTENSNEAEACNRIFDITRDQVLGMAFWNFAKKTDTLSLLKSAPGTPTNPDGATAWSSEFPAPPWLYEYGYPSDCIQLRSLVPQIATGFAGDVPLFSTNTNIYPYAQGPVARFEVASDLNDAGARINVVLTNLYQAIAQYTVRVTDPMLYSAQFVNALKYALAAKLAFPLTGKRDLRNDLFGLANDIITQARASDGNEGLTVVDPPVDWIEARDSVTGPGPEFGYWVTPYNPLFVVT